MIRVTTRILKQLSGLMVESEELEKFASERLRLAKDRHSNDKHEVKREGKKVMAEEKHLWTEVFALGEQCEAGQILKKAHPDVFEAYAKQSKNADAIKDFILQNFMVDIKQMKFTDHMKVNMAVFDYKFKWHKVLLFTCASYILIDLFLNYVK